MNEQELPFPLEIQLAESEKDFFVRRGPVPTTWDDVRRHPRFYYRTCITARIFSPHSVGSGNGELHHVLARDISRSGLSVLHSVQLYPGQRVVLRLRDGTQCATTVRWCRRLGERCYAAGCSFAQPAQAEEMMQTAT
jgi:hypothetical protein